MSKHSSDPDLEREAMEALDDLMDIRAAEEAKQEDPEHRGARRLDDFLRQIEQEEA